MLGVVCVEIWHLKCMLDMRKCREWVVDRSQNMGPNCGEFLDILGQSVAVRD